MMTQKSLQTALVVISLTLATSVQAQSGASGTSGGTSTNDGSTDTSTYGMDNAPAETTGDPTGSTIDESLQDDMTYAPGSGTDLDVGSGSGADTGAGYPDNTSGGTWGTGPIYPQDDPDVVEDWETDTGTDTGVGNPDWDPTWYDSDTYPRPIIIEDEDLDEDEDLRQ